MTSSLVAKFILGTSNEVKQNLFILIGATLKLYIILFHLITDIKIKHIYIFRGDYVKNKEKEVSFRNLEIY